MLFAIWIFDGKVNRWTKHDDVERSKLDARRAADELYASLVPKSKYARPFPIGLDPNENYYV